MRTLLLAFVLAAGCGGRPPAPTPAPTPTPTPTPTAVPDVRDVTGADYAGVAVAAALEIRPGDFFDHEIDGHWDPGDDVIARFEAGLRADLRRPDYHRQYLGLVMGGADKLHVSFYCARFDGWRSPGASVDDGGDCFYEVLYDVATGAYERVTVHGDA